MCSLLRASRGGLRGCLIGGMGVGFWMRFIPRREFPGLLAIFPPLSLYDFQWFGGGGVMFGG